MGTKDRALRRHHTARLKAKRSYYSNAQYYDGQKGGVIAIGMCYVTPCQCSCWMCGNQRKHYGDSIQERRQKARDYDRHGF